MSYFDYYTNKLTESGMRKVAGPLYRSVRNQLLKFAAETPAAPKAPQTAQAQSPSPAPAPQASSSSINMDNLTAEQLRDRWVEQKENFYRSKATKYPQYANWTVSATNRKNLLGQAQKMLETQEGRKKAWESYNQSPGEPYHDAGFDYVTTKRYNDMKEERNKKKQNPTASRAIPSAPAPNTTPQLGNGYAAQKAIESVVRVTPPHPDSLSPQSKAFRAGANQALAPLFPQNGVMSPLAQYYGWAWLNGEKPYGTYNDDFVNAWDAYTDQEHFPEYEYDPNDPEYQRVADNALAYPWWNQPNYLTNK